MGAAVDETARRGARHVAQCVGGAPHAAADFGRHRPGAVSARETDAIETRARRATSLTVAATSSPQQPRCKSGHVRGN